MKQPLYPIPPVRCPGCASLIQTCCGVPPAVGTAAVCIVCGQINAYIITYGQFGLRRATDTELDRLLYDPRIQEAILVARGIRENNSIAT